MNKLIKELMDQAGIDVEAVENLGEMPAAIKFAELIVKECISALDEKIYRSIDGDGDEIWADLILREHFGVEE
jgi:hypothetical protein